MNLNYQDSLLSTDEIKDCATGLSAYITSLKGILNSRSYDYPESSINLPLDKKILDGVLSLKESKVKSGLKYIIDIGIGGSNLGTKAIYDALLGYFDILEPERFPKMIFADTTDPEFLEGLRVLLDGLKPEEVLINAISKSGSTTETISNLEILLGDLKNRLVITTDFESPLWNKAMELGISTLVIPKTVGGRYSVFSSVGLFPLLCAGLNIDELRNGAKAMLNKCLSEDISENPALASAVILFLSSGKGFTINDNFFFHPELESLGKWYRQLMGESTGKKENGVLTPTVSIGSTDLHSMGQLYLGGPKDKITTFVSATTQPNIAIPEKLVFESLVSNIGGKKITEVMSAILRGVKIAYQKRDLPFMEVILDDLTEKSIGEYLQFKMVEIMLLGKLMEVNAFDQPNVESYKLETRKILSQA